MKNESDSVVDATRSATGVAEKPRNRFDRLEWAGAFGDLGTLIPFVAAYIAVLKMDPVGILLAFGVSMVVCGWFYRTPFPVQPMKAIGATATTQAAQLSVLTGGAVIGASLVTGVFWLILGFTGLSNRIAKLVPREVVLGIMLGLGMNFMHEGAKMMSSDWPVACVGILIAVLLRKSGAFPAMFVLLLLGFIYNVIKDASLLAQVANISFALRMPQMSITNISLNDIFLGTLYLALPQVPLTLGNAIIGMKEENNRHFPDRPVTVKGVSISTGIMNLFGAGIGGVPMCHGAGGMAAHTSFGARTGGSSIILGAILIILALGFSGSIELLLRTFPGAVLGVILFMAGIMLAVGNQPSQATKQHAFVIVATAGMAMWNVAAAFVLGVVLYQFVKRGHLDT